MRERGWAETTMAEVASAAGVSRQTLDREFGSRRDFAQAYVLRETGRFVAAGHPLIRAIVSGDGNDGLLAW